MLICPIEAADAAEWLRLRLALWPHDPAKEAAEIAAFLAAAPHPVLPECHDVFVCPRPEGACVGWSKCRFTRPRPAVKSTTSAIWKPGMSIPIGGVANQGAPWPKWRKRRRVRKAVAQWLRIQRPTIPSARQPIEA